MDLILMSMFVLVLFVLIIMFFTFIPIGLWITAFFSGVKVKMST